MENTATIPATIPTRTICGQEIPVSVLIETGAIATERAIRENANARRCLPESVLRMMAAEIARTITIRTMDGGNSHDTRRETTAAEQDTIYKIALSALLALDNGPTARESKIAEDAIINAAEYALLLLLPEANCYDTIYRPLRRSVENWRNHTEAELAFHYDR